SMESNRWGTDRAGAVRTGVKNFLTSIQNAGLGNYVNVGLIGFSSPGYIGGKSGYISVKLGKAGNLGYAMPLNWSFDQFIEYSIGDIPIDQVATDVKISDPGTKTFTPGALPD
ncbi:hypothetical protein ACI3PM_17055, partial [Lactiplantibacillus plantarum]